MIIRRGKARLLSTILMPLSLLFEAEVCAQTAGLVISVDVPQTITVGATTSAYEEVQEVIFTVTSNNGFDLSFSGASPLESGIGENPWPQFAKQDKDVTGNPIPDQFDLLPTQFGVLVAGYSTVEFLDQWGGGAVPIGSPQDLVLPLDQTVAALGGPDEAIGRIMPGVGDQAMVHLYARAVAGLEHQPGDYMMMITATVVANPQ